jgi:hypothetical protein
MTRTETHISKIRRGQQFTLSAKGRSIYTAYNTPRVPRNGTYDVRVGPRDGQSISFTVAEATVYVIKEK